MVEGELDGKGAVSVAPVLRTKDCAALDTATGALAGRIFGRAATDVHPRALTPEGWGKFFTAGVPVVARHDLAAAGPPRKSASLPRLGV